MRDKKLMAFVIDFVITIAIYNIPFYFMVMQPVLAGQKLDSHQTVVDAFLAALIAMIYMVVRDLPKKGSIGKRAMGLQLVDARTKLPASALQRVLRNLFWLLGWPEMLVYIIKGKRLGDYVSRTEIVETKVPCDF